MEQELSTKEGIPLPVSGFIEQAVCTIYEAHPHEIKTIVFAAVSLIFGYGAYKEYELIMNTAEEEEE